jgi:DNA modification methylase
VNERSRTRASVVASLSDTETSPTNIYMGTMRGMSRPSRGMHKALPQPDLAEAYRRLQGEDWTFADAQTRGDTHGIHPYPAKFIPQIPRALIAHLYPQDGTTILDPFCGSGTTLVEAAAVGAPAIGVDLSPLACLVSKVKVTPLRAGLGAAAAALATRARRRSVPTPTIPAIDHWFKHEVQRALAALVSTIADERDTDRRDALRTALSGIIVRVSNQDSDTRYAAVAKDVTEADVYERFVVAAWSIEHAVRATWGRLAQRPSVEVLHHDVLTVEPSAIGRRVSLVVTSPPYPNAYEYWLYHKYRMFWLGMDPLAVREREIGARPHYFKRNPQTAADFERQMGTVFGLLSRVVVPGGHVCFQIGNSVIRGEDVDNAALLRRVASPAGFAEVAAMSRAIPRNRKAFNLHHARICREDVLVFRLES